MQLRFLLSVLILLAYPRAVSGTYDCSNPARCTVICDGIDDHLDINSAISGANQGGEVSVASGSCTLSGTVMVSKPIILAGAGAAATTFASTASPMVTVAHGSSGFARVTGIYFDTTGYIALRLTGTILQVRVDHNKFGAADYGVFSRGQVEGVVDHNEFINCNRCVYGEGLDTAMWTIDYNAATGNFIAGGSHALFYENNTFVRNASFAKAGDEIHYQQEGFRSVFRYNTVDESAWTAGDSLPWEQHGNQMYYNSVSHPSSDTFRGQPIVEVYNNTFNVRGNPRVFSPRSGSVLIHNNVINVTGSGNISRLVVLIEEETYPWAGAHFYNNNDFIWPTEDMITNTFIWNNTVNYGGNTLALTTAHVSGWSGTDCCGTYPNANYVINFNRDVWMHAPESSGGRTYYNGRPGASGRDSDGTLVFTPAGSNAYYPYVPYKYPHPFTQPPAPPTNFRTGS